MKKSGLYFDDTKKDYTEVIIESIIHAAKKSGYKVTAEGVETKKQFEKLRDMGCDKIQGYYISKPMPPESVTVFIRSFGL